MVVEVVCTDELTHELALPSTQGLFQQIAGPRLVQMQDAQDEMRNIQRFGTAVEHLLTGKLNHLSELG